MSLSCFLRYRGKPIPKKGEGKGEPIQSTTVDLRVPYYDVEENFTLRPGAVLKYLEDAAAEHCMEIGQAIPKLKKAGFAWVLAKGQLEVYRYPRYGEHISVETWVSSMGAVSCWREYHIIDIRGKLIAASRGNWAYFDLSTRKVAKIDGAFRKGWPLRQVKALERPFGALPSPSAEDFPETSQESLQHSRREFSVLREDIDTNEHVNNVSYLRWALETVPADFYREKELRYLEGAFIGETTLGNQVEATSQIAFPYGRHTITHGGSQKVLAEAVSFWQ